MTFALVVSICLHHPDYRCAYAKQDLICARRETQHIRDDDPALKLFTYERKLPNRKIALAIERVNGCDPVT